MYYIFFTDLLKNIKNKGKNVQNYNLKNYFSETAIKYFG